MTNRHVNTVKPGRNQDQVQASSPRHYEYYSDIVEWLYKIPLFILPHQLHIYFNDMGIACKSQWGRKQFSKLKKSRMFMLSPIFIPRFQTASLVILNKEELWTHPDYFSLWTGLLLMGDILFVLASLYPVWILVMRNVNSLRDHTNFNIEIPWRHATYSIAFCIFILLLGLCRQLFLREEIFILNLQEAT